MVSITMRRAVLAVGSLLLACCPATAVRAHLNTPHTSTIPNSTLQEARATIISLQPYADSDMPPFAGVGIGSNSGTTQATRAAAIPTSIGLITFTARSHPGGILVSWKTATEYNTFGFDVYRSSDAIREHASRVTPEVIMASGDGVQETHYAWKDESVQFGSTYTYWLREFEHTGASKEYGPVTVVHFAYYTFVPVINP